MAIPINIKTGSIKRTDNMVIGIDLGTTNSLVAIVQDGKAEVLLDEGGAHAIVPSIIYFDQENMLIGNEALERMEQHPERTIYSVKRLMGKSYQDLKEYQSRISYRIIEPEDEGLVRVSIDDRHFTPVELSAELLKSLKKRAEDRLECTISKAVITVPAYFNETQRQATRDAGKLAGLDVLRIVNEPTAASLAYGLDQSGDQLIAVYDLGGGTFDISILRIEDGIFEVLATAGNTWLGGDDIDQAIIDFWSLDSDQLKPLDSLTTTERVQLRLLAEQAKKELSEKQEGKWHFNSTELSLSQSELINLSRPLIEKTLESCSRCVADAGVEINTIDKIVLVGGSTKMPFIREQVQNYFKADIAQGLNPDEVVALGAAVQADILAGNRTDLLLLDVTPLSLGIETVGGLMDSIIARNTKIPIAAGRNYTTSVDGQARLKVSVYQGERELVEHNRKLGEFILEDIPPMPAGIPKLQIRFILDADALLQVEAMEERSGVNTRVTMRPSYGVSEEEMARMLIDSIQNAEGDMKERAVREAIVEAESILKSTDKFLEQNKDALTETEVSTLKELAQALKTEIANKDKDSILSAMDRLNDFANPIAHDALERNVRGALSGKTIE